MASIFYRSLALAATALPLVHAYAVGIDARDVAVQASKAAPVAHTKNGTYQGYYLPSYNQDLFLGVPYAQPPLGDLRFRNPLSLNTSFSGKKMATSYPPDCIGYGSDDWGYPISEDCLYLNVIRPAGTTAKSELPIVAFIYGGGWVNGGSADKRYNLTFIVENSVEIGTPIIGVSLNYRVSGWGFIASGDVAGSGNTNMGLRDQRLALHWLQENIHAFGGDPSKVTIWGQSAGAESVGFHLDAYNGRDDGLFRGAIMMSGNPIESQPTYTADQQDDMYQGVLTRAGCLNTTDTLACLRALPFDTLNAALNVSGQTGWNRVIDGDFIKRYTSQQLADGDFVHVPIISGSVTDEGGAGFLHSDVPNVADIYRGIENGTYAPGPFLNLSAYFVDQILAAYPDDPCQEMPYTLGCLRPGAPQGAESRRLLTYSSDQKFTAHRRLACQTWAANGVDAYCYRYNGWGNGQTIYTGVPHFSDVAPAFYNTESLGYLPLSAPPFLNVTQGYYDMAKLMSNSFASFVATGNPNTWREHDTNVDLWPAYNIDNPQNMVWESNITSHVEADTWRSGPIAAINALNLAFHR